MWIYADTGRDVQLEVARALKNRGQLVSPRGLETLELSPATLHIGDPTDVMPTSINREGLAPVIGIAEALQGISGISNPALMERITPVFGRFLNKDAQFDGAYGPRLAQVLPRIRRRLNDDPDTRQAVAPIWWPHDVARRESKDYPCTLTLQFLIRDGALNLHVTMRSNDAWLGLPYDLYQFTQVQCAMAKSLDVRVGEYWHTATSLHVYAQHYDKMWALWPEYEETSYDLTYVHDGVGLPNMPWEEIQQRAKHLLTSPTALFGENATERSMREALTPFVQEGDVIHETVYFDDILAVAT